MSAPDSPGPTVFVLFGATGDLAKRMVLPAFFHLVQEKLLPDEWRLIGNGRREKSDDEFRDDVHEALEQFGGRRPRTGRGTSSAAGLRFAGGGFTADDPGSLLDRIARGAGRDRAGRPARALPRPAAGRLRRATAALGAHGLAEGARVVYEKPFGTSPESFRALDRAVHEVLDESQVYRIDHFLGKEATQDLQVLRFANGLFGRSWDRHHIEAVQIDVPETLDIDDRAEFYDATGAVLDMLVTHLFQVAAEVAMEPPATPRRRRPAAARGRPCASFRPLRPRRGGARAVRRLPRPRRASPTTRPPRPSSPRGSGSTTTAGAGCRSCCAPASGWPEPPSGSA